ncbi:Secreted protein OS=Rhodopirellula europaea SH398 GN=RESH_00384 PE=4 SV=1 [Gemmata massiliana]|uniref:Secreted protein n=1 Tax=Gemmata massiliana TaxID=1210884 RepID=A0A6P2D4L9_9BACT|nr:hypothetical protein [Gemmata massiliana]VTR95385.1 Secreted protein OS=Rhodopirellula europaea SH398 GN=RESH_00384 PE=4 SV=1 [Gemmata massiliana]
MFVNTYTLTRSVAVAVCAFALVGCGERVARNSSPSTPGTSNEAPEGAVAAERAKLSPEDRALVEAQEWCVISNDEQLGSMGAPIKLTIKGQPVFVCCRGCVKKAESNPDATLAKVEELKAKAKANKSDKTDKGKAH